MDSQITQRDWSSRPQPGRDPPEGGRDPSE